MAAKFLISYFAKIFLKFCEIFVATLCRRAVRGGQAGQYSPGASSALTNIVLYSSSVYTVFHSVIYNSVVFVIFQSMYSSTSGSVRSWIRIRIRG